MIQSINSKHVIKIQVFDYYESLEYFYVPEVRILGFKIKPASFRSMHNNDIMEQLPNNYILHEDIVKEKPHIVLTLVNNETFTFHYETFKEASEQAVEFKKISNSNWIFI